MAKTTAKGTKKNRKVGRNAQKCAAYAAKRGESGKQRKHNPLTRGENRRRSDARTIRATVETDAISAGLDTIATARERFESGEPVSLADFTTAHRLIRDGQREQRRQHDREQREREALRQREYEQEREAREQDLATVLSDVDTACRDFLDFAGHKVKTGDTIYELDFGRRFWVAEGTYRDYIEQVA